MSKPKEKIEKLKKAMAVAPNGEPFLKAKIALLEAELAYEKELRRNQLAVKTGRLERRRKASVFIPKFTEGARVQKELMRGDARDLALDEDDTARVEELVAMLTDETLLAKYHNWSLRAMALGLTLQRLYTLRQTKIYQTKLVEAIRGQAMESVAGAVPAQATIAKDKLNRNSTTAFDKLGKLAGLEGAKSVKITNTQINNNFEQNLRKAAMDGAKVVDVKLLEN